MSAPTYRLLCLGTAALERLDGTPCDPKAQRPRKIAVLAYLATSRQTGRTRTDITDLLWPNTAKQRALGSLATLEWDLREVLGVDVIGHSGERRWLDTTNITSDVHEFRELCRTTRYADAVSLYGGSFLKGLSLREQPRSFGTWMLSERQKLSAQLRRALVSLASADQWRALVQFWDRVETLTVEDLEPAIAYLQALVRAGDEARAHEEHARLISMLPRGRKQGSNTLREFGKTLPAARPATIARTAPVARGDSTDRLASAVAPSASLSAPELYTRALESFRRFTHDGLTGAEALFRQAVQTDPGYASAYAGLGSIFIFRYIATPENPLLDEGICHLDHALQLDPSLSEPYRWLTYAYSRRGEFDLSSQMAYKSIAYNHNDPETRYFAGGAYHTRALMEPDPEYMPRAVHEYLQAVDINPEFGWAWNGLAHLYMLHGDTGAAETAVEQALRAEEGMLFASDHAPLASGARTLKGLLLLRQGRLELAEELLREAGERYVSELHLWAPHFAILAECALGRIYELRGEFAGASRQYRTASALAFTHRARMGMGHHAVRALLGIATASAQLGDRAQAAAKVAAAAKILDERKDFDFNWVWGGSLAETYYELARYRAVAGEPEPALASLEAAATWGWSDPDAVRSEHAFIRAAIDPQQLDSVIRKMTRRALPRPLAPAPSAKESPH